ATGRSPTSRRPSWRSSRTCSGVRRPGNEFVHSTCLAEPAATLISRPWRDLAARQWPDRVMPCRCRNCPDALWESQPARSTRAKNDMLRPAVLAWLVVSACAARGEEATASASATTQQLRLTTGAVLQTDYIYRGRVSHSMPLALGKRHDTCFS